MTRDLRSRSGSLTIWTLLVLTVGLTAAGAMAHAARILVARQQLRSAMQTAALTLEHRTRWPSVWTEIQFTQMVRTNLHSPEPFILNAFQIVPLRRRQPPHWAIRAIGSQVLAPLFRFPGPSATPTLVQATLPTP